MAVSRVRGRPRRFRLLKLTDKISRRHLHLGHKISRRRRSALYTARQTDARRWPNKAIPNRLKRASCVNQKPGEKEEGSRSAAPEQCVIRREFRAEFSCVAL
ncbi:hypothetical protein EVAR_24663_1 [Eumeta japonica]|uniref:Uncharacterized protein n=1 Tax=Eumeta variegata TaxID=151549 RepID=A0A4C1WG45_EUMVA|nr:hypothetical protein EVAR_24663_1 [Eumeta japonica]